MRNRSRYIIIMVISVVLNFVLYSVASYYNLPVWMDITGTALAALVLEPTAGLLVGLVNNFYLALFVFDQTTLIYYAVSAAAALIVGIVMRKNGKLRWQRVLPTILLVITVSAVLSTLVTVWRDGGVPTAAWEIHFYEMAMQNGIPQVLSCLFGIFIMKIFDTAAVAMIVALVYLLLPQKLKYSKEVLMERRKENI